MKEEVRNPEKKGAVAKGAEMLVGLIDDGVEIRGRDVIDPEEIEEAYYRLRGIHLLAGLETDPRGLMRLLREAGRLCRMVEDPVRGVYLAVAVADMARMDFDSACEALCEETLESLQPEELSVGERMPTEYYATLGLLVEATRQTTGEALESYSPSLQATQKAAVLTGNSSYGRLVQRSLLRRLEDVGALDEMMLRAYLTVPNKVRLPAYAEENSLSKAEEAVQRLGRADYAYDNELREGERKGNYVRAIHDIMGASVVLRRKVPWLRPEELVAALYANAATIGALADRLTSANPLDHKSKPDDAGLFMERMDGAGHVLDWPEDAPYPQLVIPLGLPNTDEFPERFFGSDSDECKKQEARITRQRAHASRCPVRHAFPLPEGKTKKRIEELDTDIKMYYGVDPGIFTAEGSLNPAALTIARTIQAGVRTGIWTHGLEEFGVPAALQEVERSSVLM